MSTPTTRLLLQHPLRSCYVSNKQGGSVSAGFRDTQQCNSSKGIICDMPEQPQQQQFQQLSSISSMLKLTPSMFLAVGCIQDSTKGGLRCQKCLQGMVVNQVSQQQLLEPSLT